MLETPWWKKITREWGKYTQKKKRNPFGSIVTNADDFEKNITEKHQKPSQSGRQNVAAVCGDDGEENEDDGSKGFDKDSELSERDKSSDEEEYCENTSQLNQPLNERQRLIQLRNVWGELNPPVSEKELQGCFFSAIYYVDIHKKKKPKLFVGKLLRYYLADGDGPTVSVDLDWLAIGSPKILSEPPGHLDKDISTFIWRV